MSHGLNVQLMLLYYTMNIYLNKSLLYVINCDFCCFVYLHTPYLPLCTLEC